MEAPVGNLLCDRERRNRDTNRLIFQKSGSVNRLLISRTHSVLQEQTVFRRAWKSPLDQRMAFLVRITTYFTMYLNIATKPIRHALQIFLKRKFRTKQKPC